jgi:CPA2 family monovalent cation:H+ antiporter-2
VEHSALQDVIVLLGLALATAWAVRRADLPPLLGYLIVGVLAGPHALGWLPAEERIEFLAEVGVVLLLFTIGLEVSIPRLVTMRRDVVGLGLTQVALTTGLLGLVAWLAGMAWETALVVGGALSLSSTALVVRQLGDQLELHSRHGRATLAVLLAQDLAAVPFLVLIPLLAASSGGSILVPLALALLKGVLALGLVLALGHWLLRPFLHAVAASHSAEVFTLAVVFLALGAAWATSLAGLSFALGAFLAGLMLGETEYRHQVEADVRPFRDVLLALFFLSVGMHLDPVALAATWSAVLLVLGVLVIGKAVLVVALTRLAGYEPGVAMRTGLVLAQGGEFSFALLTLAVGEGVATAAESQVVLAGTLLSMLLAPVLIRYNGAVAKRVCAASYLRGRALASRQLDAATRDLERHVVICGFGRIGQNLAGFLREEGIPYVALDLDPALIREAWEAGEQVFYGDSTHTEVLEAAGLTRASALVVTFDDAATATRIIAAARRLAPELPLVVRTHDDAHLEALERAGATVVVPEAVEASMMLATHLLERIGVPAEEVLRLVESARADHYRRLRGVFHGEEEVSLEHADRYRLHTVVVPPEGHAVGRTLAELGVATDTVSVQAVRRGAIRGEEPTPEMVLRAGDAVVLQGPAEELAVAEERLLRGA